MSETLGEGAVMGGTTSTRVAGALVGRPWLFSLATPLVLTLGFAILILALTQLAIVVRPSEELRTTQTALILYARIVLVKALWPHVLLTLPLYLLAQRSTGLAERPRLHQCAAFFGIAIGTGALITAVFLPSALFGLPVVHAGSAANFVAVSVEIAVGTTAAATVANALISRMTAR